MNTVTVANTRRKPAGEELVLVPGQNCVTGIKEFTKYYPAPTSLESDLLRVAAGVYCADLATKRGLREEFQRDIELHVPVANFQAFERARLDIETALTIVSGDNWTLSFHRSEEAPEAPVAWPTNPGEVLLFSGGLDSLAGAHERLTTRDTPLVLVSHVTHNNIVKSSQETLFGWLSETFGERVTREHFFVSGRTTGDLPFPQDSDREETQRTRSFLFLTLGALVARRRGISRVLMIAENGQMAIHLPLTAARVGAFSTKTAHPSFLAEMERILSTLLEFPLEIHNPFLYLTKAEVVKRLVKEAPGVIEASGSCWKAFRVGSGFRHCGECIPCLIRRIALEHGGLKLPEYKRDLLREDISSLDPDDLGKRNLAELLDFVMHFHRDDLRASALDDFPELLAGTFEAGKAIDMYTRFAKEAVTVLSRYPGVRGLLS